MAITPGFVNAHTHLDLDPIAPAAGDGPEDEVDWLRRVVERPAGGPARLGGRGGRGGTSRPSVEAGTTLLADTTTAGQSWEAVAAAPLRGVVFAELIGLNRLRGIETSGAAFEWLATVRDPTSPTAKTRPGLSPHAPYSTAGWLYHRAAVEQAARSRPTWPRCPRRPNCSGPASGRLRRFLEDLGAWDDDWEPIGPRPADYIRRGDLRQADWLVAHGNYFDPDEFWQLRPEAAPGGQRVAVAYCPRTHARFGHAPHPYRAMLERGIVVCLGTDSLASSPTLGVLDEVRFLHRVDESAGGELLLTMATLFGAWALRSERRHREPQARQVGRPRRRRPARPRRARPPPPAPRIRPARRRHDVPGRVRPRPRAGLMPYRSDLRSLVVVDRTSGLPLWAMRPRRGEPALPGGSPR